MRPARADVRWEDRAYDAEPPRERVWRRVVVRTASPLGFAVVVGLTILRQLVRPLFIDFQNGLYTPTNAFLAGGDPYSEAYLAAAKVPFAYPPHALLTFLPFAAPPYPMAAALYFVFGIASMLLIATLSLRLAGITARGPWLWGTAIALLLCRPGHMVIAQGQPTILILPAALVVIGILGGPWPMSWALAITTIKPTFGAPLLLLTLARGQTAIAVRALVIAGGLALYPVAVLAARAGGLLPFLTSFWTNYQHWLAGPDNGAATSIYRVDAAALLGHVVGQPLPSTVELVLSATLVLAAGLMLRHRARRPSHVPDHVETSLIVTTVLTAVYHQTYDLLLLAPVGVALAAHRDWPLPGQPLVRWTFLAVLALSAVNYLATHAAIAAFGLGPAATLALSSWNALALLVLFVGYLALAGMPAKSAFSSGYVAGASKSAS